MSEIIVKTIEPATGTSLTLGTSGDTVAVSSDSAKLDIWKDSGGNTIFQSDGAGTLSNVNSGFAGEGPKLITSQTAAAGTSYIEFTSGINSTYKEYVFYFYDVNPSADGPGGFTVGFSQDAGDNWGLTKTTTIFSSDHNESDTSEGIQYQQSHDLAESTSPQRYPPDPGNDADECCTGEMHLINPSSGTFAKQFYGVTASNGSNLQANNTFYGGYIHAGAITGVRWGMSTGTFSGTVKMYGIV